MYVRVSKREGKKMCVCAFGEREFGCMRVILRILIPLLVLVCLKASDSERYREMRERES